MAPGCSFSSGGVMKRSIGSKLIAVAILLAVGVVGAWAFVWSGIYPIGADEPHTAPVHALMTHLRSRSIAAGARDVKPRDLRDENMIASGAKNYSEMCVGCHLAPGVTKSELRDGLYPQPPNLSEPKVRDPREMFWVIKHGVKMSAMPAWGRSHDDDAIWAMVAFISSMPTMQVARYQQLAGAASSGHGVSHREQPTPMHGMDHAQLKGMQAEAKGQPAANRQSHGDMAGANHGHTKGMQPESAKVRPMPSPPPRASMGGMDHGQMHAKTAEPAMSPPSTRQQPPGSMDHGQMHGKNTEPAKPMSPPGQPSQGALEMSANAPAAKPEPSKSVSPAFEGYRSYNPQEMVKGWRAANEEVREAGGHVGMAKGAHGAGHREDGKK